jgi:catechol 2,3-dioxygenase-like lactoylglutathione lyase family enzyme
MNQPLTSGVHHVGLAVPDTNAAERFFVDALGWTVVGGVPSYPATFVSDGTIMVTLWRVSQPDRAVPFNRRSNVGLHHLALKVPDHTALATTFQRVRSHPGVAIEFEPTPMREGSSTHHFMCAIPGGIRVEFATATP